MTDTSFVRRNGRYDAEAMEAPHANAKKETQGGGREADIFLDVGEKHERESDTSMNGMGDAYDTTVQYEVVKVNDVAGAPTHPHTQVVESRRKGSELIWYEKVDRLSLWLWPWG